MALDFPGTPATGTTYTGPGGVIWVWDSQKWVSGTLTTGIYAPITNDVGRNLIHNSMFNIAQRGAGPFTTLNAYTLDRWILQGGLDVASITRGAIADAGRTAIGDEAAAFALSNNFTGNAGASAWHAITQWIEGVRRLGGKTVTVSFWAICASGTPKLGVSIDQFFDPGSGGSATVVGVGQSVTLSTTWTRYSLIFAIPSTTGKTLGTSGGDATGLNFWFSSGATNATRAGNIGVQGPSVIINLCGVQLELGPTATPLEKLDPVTQLQQCQRFYQVGSFAGSGYSGAAGGFLGWSWQLPVLPRGAPLVTPTFTASTNITGPTLNNTANSLSVTGTATAVGNWAATGTFTASADL